MPLRHPRREALALLALVLLLFPGAAGAAPRVILAEDFNATWCPYCPHARCALEQLLTEFPEQLLVAEHHVQDDLTLPWSTARKEEFYALNGLPLVIFDGYRFHIGASSCEGSTTTYRNSILQRLAASPANPVSVTGAYAVDLDAQEVTVTASFLLEAEADLGVTTAYFLIIEDDVTFGGVTYQHVTRAAYEEPVSLLEPGDLAVVSAELPIDLVEDPQAIALIAFLQRGDGNKEVHQAARLGQTSAVADGLPGPRAPAAAITRVAPSPYSMAHAGGPLRMALRLPAGEGAAVTIDLLDASGRRIGRLFDGALAGGEQALAWRPSAERPLAPGRYFLRLRWPGGVTGAPLLIVR
jgi:thiol-disulfide isomerase/thioredoxin